MRALYLDSDGLGWRDDLPVPRPLIDAEYPLSAALGAMEHAARPGVRKVLLDCGPES